MAGGGASRRGGHGSGGGKSALGCLGADRGRGRPRWSTGDELRGDLQSRAMCPSPPQRTHLVFFQHSAEMCFSSPHGIHFRHVLFVVILT